MALDTREAIITRTGLDLLFAGLETNQWGPEFHGSENIKSTAVFDACGYVQKSVEVNKQSQERIWVWLDPSGVDVGRFPPSLLYNTDCVLLLLKDLGYEVSISRSDIGGDHYTARVARPDQISQWGRSHYCSMALLAAYLRSRHAALLSLPVAAEAPSAEAAPPAACQTAAQTCPPELSASVS